jgi:hypothetical protein
MVMYLAMTTISHIEKPKLNPVLTAAPVMALPVQKSKSNSVLPAAPVMVLLVQYL